MHPARFRIQYEEQMLWIFDESRQSRGATSLLADAFVSLLRQWVLRSGQWRNSQSTITADGAMAIPKILDLNSQRLFRRAWRWNVLWTFGAFWVLCLCPVPIGVKFVIAGLAAHSVLLLFGKKAAVTHTGVGFSFVSLFHYKNSREFHQAEIEARRDALRTWIRGDIENRMRGAGGIFFMLGIVTLSMLVFPIIGNYLGWQNTGVDWEHSRYFFLGLIVITFSWRFMRSLSERAVQAFQDEIDAMDDPAGPSSV